MSLSSAAVAQAAALSLPGLLSPPVVVVVVVAHRSVVIVAAGGRDLVWSQERIASALLQRSGGRAVHLLLHGGSSPSLPSGAVMAALPAPSAIAFCWSRP